MTKTFLYQYPPLVAGTLLKRYKRFLADIELETGEMITAHCPNTGKMTGVCTPGSLVQVSKSDNKKRKLAYTLEMIQVHDSSPTWVGINTTLPNKVIKIALEKQLFPEWNLNYTEIFSEVPYGKDHKSRIDFLLKSDSNLPIYLEIKNTTLAQENMALFPDTVTTRGQKHLQELISLLPQAHGIMLYFINRSDCVDFAPGDSLDPVYGKLLREAINQGVKILPCRFEVTPTSIYYLGLANLILN